jgi:lipopolysaccharide/colanic/teichoic acid biosynthesis glycosyltransferase
MDIQKSGGILGVSGSLVETRSQLSVYDTIKRLLDLTLALVLTLLAAPVVFLCMIAVRLGSAGTPLYRQRRLGLHGRVFTIYKIRTMYADSERWCGPVWSTPGDSRITPIGRFLRWCHVDELPQLVNVIRGEMSLIGPRPERPEIVAQLEAALPGYRERLSIRPGLSGLAQVLQEPDVNLRHVRRKVSYDLYYITHMSLWLDLKIVLATMLHVAHVPAQSIAFFLQLPDARVSRDPELSQAAESLPASPFVHPYYTN